MSGLLFSVGGIVELMNMFWIKVIAVVSMLVDHFGLFFFPHSFVLQVAGRISFPLFAWLIANGARYTHDIDAYLRRLFMFALISQVPYYIGYYVSGHFHWFHNVLFTLFLGLLAIRLTRLTERKLAWIIAVISCMGMATLLNTDYGATGVLSVFAFYLFFNRFAYMALSETLILGIIPLALYSLVVFTQSNPLPFYYTDRLEIYGLLALPLIYMYSHERGPRVQYFFYWFFPLQSLAILALSLLIQRPL